MTRHSSGSNNARLIALTPHTRRRHSSAKFCWTRQSVNFAALDQLPPLARKRPAHSIDGDRPLRRPKTSRTNPDPVFRAAVGILRAFAKKFRGSGIFSGQACVCWTSARFGGRFCPPPPSFSELVQGWSGVAASITQAVRPLAGRCRKAARRRPVGSPAMIRAIGQRAQRDGASAESVGALPRQGGDTVQFT
jgi:hypothetical protein